jgi:hypothetical protein
VSEAELHGGPYLADGGLVLRRVRLVQEALQRRVEEPAFREIKNNEMKEKRQLVLYESLGRRHAQALRLDCVTA